MIEKNIYIEPFGQKYVILVEPLQSEQMEQHMFTIGVYKLLSNSDLYEHRCLQNITKLYKSSGKCDYQQQYKAILGAAMVSTTEGLTENIPMSLNTSVPVDKPNARNPFRKFSELLDVKQKTYVRRLGDAESKYKAIRTGHIL